MAMILWAIIKISNLLFDYYNRPLHGKY